MKRFFRDDHGPALVPGGSVTCIGGFDGIHRGHQALLARVAERARARQLASVALSFEPLPRQHFQGFNGVARLSSPRQRIQRLGEYVDSVGLLRFGQRLAALPAEQFVQQVLVDRLQAREIWVGTDFRFGAGRRGDLALLRAMGLRWDFDCHALDPVLDAHERISATRIRALLAESDFAAAARLLGRPYALAGRVVRGLQLGRTLGFPTANIRLPWGRAPIQGIFATWVHGCGLERWPAVASLGTRPTVQGKEPLLEAHLLDYAGDLYGQVLSVEFVAKLRDEACFTSLDALARQIACDAQWARQTLHLQPAQESAP